MEPDEFKYDALSKLNLHQIKQALYAQACFTVVDLMRELEEKLDEYQLQKEELAGLER